MNCLLGFCTLETVRSVCCKYSKHHQQHQHFNYKCPLLQLLPLPLLYIPLAPTHTPTFHTTTAALTHALVINSSNTVIVYY